jgi:hypothetical protein
LGKIGVVDEEDIERELSGGRRGADQPEQLNDGQHGAAKWTQRLGKNASYWIRTAPAIVISMRRSSGSAGFDTFISGAKGCPIVSIEKPW